MSVFKVDTIFHRKDAKAQSINKFESNSLCVFAPWRLIFLTLWTGL